jgi:hypothetical protein
MRISLLVGKGQVPAGRPKLIRQIRPIRGSLLAPRCQTFIPGSAQARCEPVPARLTACSDKGEVMTITRKLESTGWQPYFDHLSAQLASKRVDLEVDCLNIGSQVAAKWVALTGITYDKNDNLIAIMADGLDHMIRRPRDVFVETDGVDLVSMEIIDSEGVVRILRFSAPFLLPSP